MKETPSWPDLGSLRALGFGLDAALMNDPKLFVDRRFLAALLDQLERELGPAESEAMLFQVGLLHGLRDAQRVVEASFAGDGTDLLEERAAAPLPMQLNRQPSQLVPGSIEIAGSWPEGYEADARLARLGPDTHPRCALSAGYTSGWLSGTLEADILAIECECAAGGHGDCRFVAREAEAWRADGDPRATATLDRLSFERCREVAGGGAEPVAAKPARPAVEEPLDDQGEFDRDAHVVHVWGPVMILPYTNADEALHTVEMLSRDPATAETRCVVVDLRENPVDEAFGAAALEQLIDVVESWGAEPILTGLSVANERAVHDLETGRLLLSKDLPEAIAAAFQIAEAQRDLL